MRTHDRGEIPISVTTADVVESKMGRLEFQDGYPSPEAAATLRDEMSYLHGVQAFMNSIQACLCGRSARASPTWELLTMTSSFSQS